MTSSAAPSPLQAPAIPDDGYPATVHHAQFSVNYNYPIAFTSDVFNPANPVLVDILRTLEPQKRHRVLVLIDEGVAKHTPQLSDQWRRYADHHTSSIESPGLPIVVPGGENAKNDPHLQESLSQAIEDHGIDRHSYVVAIGGGAMLDAVGLSAATAHRGVRLVRVPTTVLAQNDAGIGVKNGINRFGQKNWYGTFAPPFAVINDDHFLKTLSPIHRRAGMSEAVKVALIRDAAFFNWIEANAQALARFETGAVSYLIQRCAVLHLEQITQSGDPFERGTARPLDFGHWAAHRLEKMTEHRLSHGDAVAMGIALDSRYSRLTGLLDELSLSRILEVLRILGFPQHDCALNKKDDAGQRLVLAGLEDFQRHLGGKLTITLLSGIGIGVEVHEMNEEKLEVALCEMHAGENTCN